jgi:phosphate transport system permease protein
MIRFGRDVRRRVMNRVMGALALVSVGLALIPLGSILFAVVVQGVSVINLEFFTGVQPVPCSPGPGNACVQGGIGNAIVGTFLLLGASSAIGIPVGLLAGIYLAEYGRGPLVFAVRFFADVMTGLPSIVMGLFIFAAFEILSPGNVFSALAGALALAVMVIPFVARTSEEALRLVPGSIREAALALGVPRYRVTVRVVLSSAREGIVTGALLAIARIGGETAPLLMTALGNSFYSTRLDQPIAAMPLVIYNFATTPYANWNALAWGTALLLVLIMLSLSISARVLLRRRFREQRIRG